MRGLVYNIILALAGYFIFRNAYDVLNYDRPLTAIAVYTGCFTLFWLLSFFFNQRYFFKLPRLIRFIGYITKELFVSNLRVARDVIMPFHQMNPAIIAVPLDAASDREIVTLATLITFTPGTLSLKVSDDKKYLYIHEMYIPHGDVEAVRKRIKNGFEKRIIQLSR